MAYRNLWSSPAGFIDREISVMEQVRDELREELGCEIGNIVSIKKVDQYEYCDKIINKRWIRHVYVADVSNFEVTLDWEHTEFRWVSLGEFQTFDLTPGLFDDARKVSKVID